MADLKLWREWLRLERECELLSGRIIAIESALPRARVEVKNGPWGQAAHSRSELHKATRPGWLPVRKNDVEAADRLEVALWPALAEKRRARAAAIRAADLPRLKRAHRKLGRQVEAAQAAIEFSPSAGPVAIAARAHLALEEAAREGGARSNCAILVKGIIRAVLPALPEEMAIAMQVVLEDHFVSLIAVHAEPDIASAA